MGELRGPKRRGRNTRAEEARLVRVDLADYPAHGVDLGIFNYHFGVKENPDGTFSYKISRLGGRDLSRRGGLRQSAQPEIYSENRSRRRLVPGPRLPLAVRPPLDQCYVGEPISWTIASNSSKGQVKVQLWSQDWRVAEHTIPVGTDRLEGEFEVTTLVPRIYTLGASVNSIQSVERTDRRQILLAPDNFDLLNGPKGTP